MQNREDKKYQFKLFGNGDRNGWWLKVPDDQTLSEWHTYMDDAWSKALQNIKLGKEFGNKTSNHSPYQSVIQISFLIYNHACLMKLDFEKAMADIRTSLMLDQSGMIKRQGCIYVNQAGGWCHVEPGKLIDETVSNELKYPDMKGEVTKP